MLFSVVVDKILLSSFVAGVWSWQKLRNRVPFISVFFLKPIPRNETQTYLARHRVTPWSFFCTKGNCFGPVGAGIRASSFEIYRLRWSIWSILRFRLQLLQKASPRIDKIATQSTWLRTKRLSLRSLRHGLLWAFKNVRSHRVCQVMQ